MRISNHGRGRVRIEFAVSACNGQPAREQTERGEMAVKRLVLVLFCAATLELCNGKMCDECVFPTRERRCVTPPFSLQRFFSQEPVCEFCKIVLG